MQEAESMQCMIGRVAARAYIIHRFGLAPSPLLVFLLCSAGPQVLPALYSKGHS